MQVLCLTPKTTTGTASTTETPLVDTGAVVVDWDLVPGDPIKVGWTSQYSGLSGTFTFRQRIGGAPATFGPAGTIVMAESVALAGQFSKVNTGITKPAGRKYWQATYQSPSSATFLERGMVASIIAPGNQPTLMLVDQVGGGSGLGGGFITQWLVDFDQLPGSALTVSLSGRMFSIPPYTLTPNFRVRIGGSPTTDDGTVVVSIPVGALSETTPDGAIVGATAVIAKPAGVVPVKLCLQVVGGFCQIQHCSIILQTS